jgi:hypothetical protein
MCSVENAEVHNCIPGDTQSYHPEEEEEEKGGSILYEIASLTYRRVKMVVVRMMMTSVCALETWRGDFDQNSTKHCLMRHWRRLREPAQLGSVPKKTANLWVSGSTVG